MREQAAELLDDVWSHRPELVETVVGSAAFDAFVRSLGDYTTAGLDPRELLAQVNVAKLDDPGIRDTGAFATYSLRRVGDRQLDEIDEARQRADQRAQREQQQREAADTLRQAWSHAPKAAERVITGPAFRLLVEQVATAHATAHAAGHDVGDLLGTLSPDLLTGPHVHNPSGAVTYALKRAVEHAETEPGPAGEQPLSQHTSEQLLRLARSWDSAHSEPARASQPEQPAPTESALDRLAAVHAAAARFYAHQLEAHPGELDYLAERLPDVDTARERFTVGYAPGEWRAATDHLRQLGYTDQDLLDAGIATQASHGGLIDRMRGRIVVGLHDEHGRLAGWIGRDRTGRDETPKYLNSPSSAPQPICSPTGPSRTTSRGSRTGTARKSRGNSVRHGPRPTC